jgi:Tc5 transposase DNA-binding domain
MDKSTRNARIELALAELNQQDNPNILKIAKKFGIVESTLRRRATGQHSSHQVSSIAFKQRLSFAQEEVLIYQINQLAERRIPPTSSIVRNLAEEIIGGPVGKNWTGNFVRRHPERLKSLYLRNIDKQRSQSEYAPLYKQFYDFVQFQFPFSTLQLRFTDSITNLF